MQSVTIGNATLYCGDCIEILPTIQKQIDAVVSDPPYGIKFQAGASNNGRVVKTEATKKIHGDDKPFDPAPWLDVVNATDQTESQNNIKTIVLWGADHYKSRLPDYGAFLVWDKSCGTGGATSFTDAEFAWMNRKNARCIYRQLWLGVLREGEYIGKRTHPSQKPVELMRWCLETARIGLNKTVCDPYMGSGSTGVACVTSGRKFIGIEIDSEYFDIACKRIEDAQRQSELALVV